MTNYIQWLETMIDGCNDLGDMEREKAIYQNCLKKARNLGQNLPIQHGSQQRELLIGFYRMLEDEGKFPNTCGWAELWVDKFLKANL